jgi:glycolate oxidase FAD binding subunit
LSALEALAEQYGLLSTGLIHAGSGLGIVRLSGAMEAVKSAILTLRSRCEQADTSSNRTTTQQGFLTILEAPASLKQQLDVWGYSGNALALMRKIKQQFDPQNILSPGRFIGGI